MRVGAIEAGGTKFVLAVGSSTGQVEHRTVIATTTPEETMGKVLTWFKEHPIERLGIGSFGPVDLNSDSPTYGSILASPKLAWRGFNYLSYLNELSIPIFIDTDVNVCALAEATLGSATDVESCVYITVGTGIGGGLYLKGQTVKGLQHPEMGHVPVIRHPKDEFAGMCPSHKNCLEGLASGPAIEARWQQKASDLPQDHLAFEIQSDYMAQAILTYASVVSPHRFILGGGVMKVPGLLKRIQQKVLQLNNGYLAHLDTLENYIVRPKLGDDVGVIGCFLLTKG